MPLWVVNGQQASKSCISIDLRDHLLCDFNIYFDSKLGIEKEYEKVQLISQKGQNPCLLYQLAIKMFKHKV